jgi:lantibiotic modifying enzyme
MHHGCWWMCLKLLKKLHWHFLEILHNSTKVVIKKMKWKNTLALFNVDIRHKLGKDNVVPDAVSWKHQLKGVYVGEIKLQKEVQLMSCHDEFSKEIKQNIQKGIESHFSCKMDCCGTSKINSMFWKGCGLKRMSWWTPCGPWWCKKQHNIL